MHKKWLSFINSKNVVLASGSARRIELLSDLGIKFTSQTSDFPEDLSQDGLTAKEYVEKTSIKKFEYFINKINGSNVDIVITADTIVEQNGKIFEKPDSEQQIYDWFKLYSENKVNVYTCVVIGCITNGLNRVNHFTVETEVYFDKITNDLVMDYIATGEPFGKAGGFTVQGIGKQFIKKINGCYYNVVGFPVNEFVRQLDVLLSSIENI